MPIDFTLTPELLCLRGDARAFACDVLSKVGSATRDLPTPLARFAATRPFYEQTVGAGFVRRLIPAPLGSQGTGIAFLPPGGSATRLSGGPLGNRSGERKRTVRAGLRRDDRVPQS